MRSPVPTVYGTGLVALDVVMPTSTVESPHLWAGGTCGNVLAILGFLGWKSAAINRLRNDAAGECVRADLAQWSVDLRYVGLQPACSTPIVVEEIIRGKTGRPRHRFSWMCPDCGAYLPGFRPITIRAAQELESGLPAPSVFFFDRVSPGSLTLARRFAKEGTLIFFEPSANGDSRLFQEAIKIAHVVKYSNNRVRGFVELLAKASPLLQVETLGEDGLRFKWSTGTRRANQWSDMPGFEVVGLRDAAGAGDWCTAGMIAKIGARGVSALASASRAELEDTLRYGQALAAWNCGFEGARGGMYRTRPIRFHQAIKRILSGVSTKRRATSRRIQGTSSLSLQAMCQHCQLVVDNVLSSSTEQTDLLYQS